MNQLSAGLKTALTPAGPMTLQMDAGIFTRRVNMFEVGLMILGGVLGAGVIGFALGWHCRWQFIKHWTLPCDNCKGSGWEPKSTSLGMYDRMCDDCSGNPYIPLWVFFGPNGENGPRSVLRRKK